MSRRIVENLHNPFGGAVVIVPPAEGGHPIEILLLNESTDPALFWKLISDEITKNIRDLDARNSNLQRFPQR